MLISDIVDVTHYAIIELLELPDLCGIVTLYIDEMATIFPHTRIHLFETFQKLHNLARPGMPLILGIARPIAKRITAQ